MNKTIKECNVFRHQCGRHYLHAHTRPVAEALRSFLSWTQTHPKATTEPSENQALGRGLCSEAQRAGFCVH